jgi:hypothetical protein
MSFSTKDGFDVPHVASAAQPPPPLLSLPSTTKELVSDSLGYCVWAKLTSVIENYKLSEIVWVVTHHTSAFLQRFAMDSYT